MTLMFGFGLLAFTLEASVAAYPTRDALVTAYPAKEALAASVAAYGSES